MGSRKITIGNIWNNRTLVKRDFSPLKENFAKAYAGKMPIIRDKSDVPNDTIILLTKY